VRQLRIANCELRIGPAAIFTVAVTLGILALPLSVYAQAQGKVWRIGFLSATSPSSNAESIEALRQGLRELGYAEGQNIVIEYRWAEGRFERLPDLAAELVRLKVDVIVASTGQAALAAKNSTATIPIIMVGTADPVGSGLVASLAQPGGNVTGLSLTPGLGISGKQLELLHEAFPKLRQVAVLANPAAPVTAGWLRETELAARSLGVQLRVVEVRDPDELDGAFSTIKKAHARALLVIADALLALNRSRIVAFAASSRLPATYPYRSFVNAGGLMSYGVNVHDLFRRAATYVDKILKGAKASGLPVERPTRFELVINLKTAKAIGLTIPPSLLMRADEVIE
jgi:putative tryptophan/tyrosine transport system substrate-binding protein